MYLSKFELNRRDPGVRQCLRDCRDMHRSLMRLFDVSRQEAGVLYRFAPKSMQVYVLSSFPPHAQDAARGMQMAGVRDLTRLEESFCAGQNYAFDLLACPSKKTPQAESRNSRRRLLRTGEERLTWLQIKGKQGGFEVLWAREEVQPELYGSHGAGQGGEMYWGVVHFTGRLCITDAEKFRAAYRGGVGPGRAYGLGMLLLTGWQA